MGPSERHGDSMKVINDAIHGQFTMDGVTEELLHTPEINKLSHIKQLGLAHLVFPGAHHTRFEHSMGASHVAGMMADSLGLDEHEKSTVEVAAMLHDVGHGPYSHTLEHILSERGGMDHMSVTEGIIVGEYDVLVEGEGLSLPERKSIPELLEQHDLDPKHVASLIRGPDASGTERSLLSWTEGMSDFSEGDQTMAHLIHGPVDCDQMDYLLRDSHFTGVKHGVIDHHRLIASMGSQGGDIVVDQGGLSALEGMLVARGLMYSAVYFHRVTRVTEVMLSRAVERAGDGLPDSLDLQRRVDAEIWGALDKAGGFAQEMITRLKYRRLLKICLSKRREDLSDEQIEMLVSIANDSETRRTLEEELAYRSGLEPGYVAIDVPSVKLLLSEPRMAQVDVRIVGDDGKTRRFKEMTTLADALKRREVSQDAVYVMTVPGAEKKVSEIAERQLFS
ncbi:MAG TPA: HD domain-containing protein [Candidatus Thalassarchaeaceae archaeon]|nr:HD domain-containing protein [Candidatus Thalassarchaeaceae archaeon]|tara:strand:+ start:4705 stop:6051 length:1347 start_codon:yes stop_codon:yes gene_type:complete